MVPEFAVLTGLDDSIRKNYTTMRNIAVETNPKAEEKIKNIESLITGVVDKKNDCKVFQDWGISFNPNPYKVDYDKLNPGRLLMGENKWIDLVTTGSCFERETQGAMYDYNKLTLERWGIFYLDGKKKTFNDFISNFKQIMS